MNQAQIFSPTIAVPNWLPPEEARRHLEGHIETFVAAASAPSDDIPEPAPALAMKVTAGAGKTSTLLRVLARHADALLSRGHVLIYMPTLALADRAAEDFRAIAPDVPCSVIRGRAAASPDDPAELMCSQGEKVAKLNGVVWSITEALCRAKNEVGEIIEAPCARGCPYLAQRDMTGTCIFFLSHSYLTAQPPIDPNFKIALRIVDEKCWESLTETSEIFVEDFMRPAIRSPIPNAGREEADVKAAIIAGLQSGEPLHEYLKRASVSSEYLTLRAEAEVKHRARLNIRPWHQDDEFLKRTRHFNRVEYFSSVTREAIYKLLSGCAASVRNRLTIQERQVTGQTRLVLRVHSLTPLPRDAPVLLLDADANPEITQRLAPGATFVAIDIKPQADVLQVPEYTYSNTWLLDPNKGRQRRAKILNLVEYEVQRSKGKGVLLVATKAVLEELHADIGQIIDTERDPELMPSLLGASTRWFGPRLLGVNDFEDYTTGILVGRLQPRPIHIEDAARCVFGDDSVAIRPHVDGPLPEITTYRLMANDEMHEAKTRAHPDPRAEVLHGQMRDAQSLQSIARLRLASPRHPKRTILLGNLPLPGFPVTRLVPLEAILRGLETEPDFAGFLRLEAAFSATMGQPVRGARLSGAGLHADLPEDFEAESAGAEFRRGRSTDHVIALAQRVAAANGWPATLLRLRSARGGHGTPAILFCNARSAIAQARALWPDLQP